MPKINKMEKTEFEIKRFSIDYYVGSKYVGSMTIEKPDREIFGYQGRKTEPLKTPLQTKKKIIPVGTLVTTELIPICGRIKS